MRRIQSLLIAFGIAVAALLVFAPTQAAASCVNPTGTLGCYSQIQSAVDNANPGETIYIYPLSPSIPGTYFENIKVPYNKAGIKLVGTDPSPDKVIIDGEIEYWNYHPPKSCISLWILAPNVLVQNLSFRNGYCEAIQTEPSAQNVTIDKVNFKGPQDECIEIHSPGATIQNSNLFGCGDTGIRATCVPMCNGLTVKNTTIRNTDEGGIYTDSVNNVVIDKCEMTVIEDDDCIDLYNGDNATVTNNKLLDCDGHGILIWDGRTANVSTNTITGMDDDGITVQEDNATINANTIHLTDGTGIEVYDGDNSMITSNTINDIVGYGIYVSGYASTIKSNTISDTYDDEGIQVDGDSATVTLNNVQHTYDDGDGVEINGDYASVTSNTVAHNEGDGIEVYGNNATVSTNTVNDNGYNDEAGVYVDGDYAKVLTNKVSYSFGYGIQVDGDQPQVKNNTVTYTLYDDVYVYCSDYMTPAACHGANVTANNASYGIDDSWGFYFDHAQMVPDPAYFVVANNVAYRCAEGGYYFTNSRYQVTGNTASECGSELCEPAFYFDGSNQNTIKSNTALRNDGDGFFVMGSDNALTSNTAQENIENGFEQGAGIRNRYTYNQSLNNIRIGIQINALATQTTLSQNKACGNRTDYCNHGVGTLEGPDTFCNSGPEDGCELTDRCDGAMP